MSKPNKLTPYSI